MKKFFSFILFLIVLAVVGSIGGEIYAAKNVKIKIDSIKPTKTSLTNVDLNLKIKATNAAPFDTYIKSQHIEIYQDKDLIGNVDKNEAVALAKNSTIYLEYPIKANSLGMIQLLWKRFISKQPIEFHIKGTLMVRSRWTGITQQVEIDRIETYDPNKK